MLTGDLKQDILQSNYLWPKSYKPKHQPLINYFVLFFLFFIRDQSWAEENKMGAFLSVGKGSTEPSVFLEMRYSGAKTKDSSPLVFVGKGKTSWNPACFKINAFSYPLLFTKLGKWVTGLYFRHFLKASMSQGFCCFWLVLC